MTARHKHPKHLLTRLRNYWQLLVVGVVLLFGAARLGGVLLNRGVSLQLRGLGSNNSLQLGGQNKERKSSQLESLQLTKETAALDFVSAKAGHYHTLLLTKSGEVYALGANALHAVSSTDVQFIGEPARVIFPDLKPKEIITQIDTSRDHNIALTNQGRVYTWGSNYTAQLGDGTNADRGTPKIVEGLPKVREVTASYRHSAVITEQNELYGWGGSCTDQTLAEAKDMIARLGEGISALGAYGSVEQADLTSKDPGECATQGSTFVQSKTPKRLEGMQGVPVEISVGYGHLLVRSDSGELFSAGCNSFEQLGRKKATGDHKNDLAKVTIPGKIVHVSAGFRHSVIQLEDGRVYAWGYNGFGSALHVASREFTIPEPMQVEGNEAAADIEAAHDTTFIVTPGNELKGWGQDDAEAFWSLQSSRETHGFGAAKPTLDGLSAGMRHVLVLENK